MGNLGNLRPLAIDLQCLCGGHLGLERGGRRGLFDTSNRSSPRRPRVGRSALAAQRTFYASRLSCVVHARMHAMAAIEPSATSQDLSGGTSEAIAFGIVGESVAQEVGAATLRIPFHRLPAVLPRSIKVHTAICRRLHGRMIGVIPIGHDLFWCPSQRRLATFQGWL